jgi:predicted O-methyltransferase YrrM
MSETVWKAVDDYLFGALIGPDAALDAALKANAAAGLPAIDVSPAQGKVLYLLAKMCRARRVLEVGTLGGYSTIWLARALPADGRVITLELEQKHADVARSNVARAGLAGVVEVRVGPAGVSLAELEREKVEPFDLIFIDADKESGAAYLEVALRLSRAGTVIMVDNVIRDGAVADASSTDPRVIGSRRVLEMMGGDPRLEASALQMVGAKGYDGFAIGVVRG